MKKIVFTLLFAALLVACNKDSELSADMPNNTETPAYLTQIQEEAFFKENKTFTIGKGGSSKIAYQGRIGYDFDSALDSLIRKYEPLLHTLTKEGHYSGEGFNIAKEKMNIDFSYDSREFFLLTISDKTNIYQILFSGDVIDEKGNYFRCMWAED